MRTSRINIMTLTVFMAVLSAILSVVPVAALFFAPLPITLSYAKNGLQAALTTTALALGGLLMFGGPQMGALFLLGTALPALMLGYCLQQKWRPAAMFCATALAYCIGSLASMELVAFLTGISIGDTYHAMMQSLYPDVAQAPGLKPFYDKLEQQLHLTREAFLETTYEKTMLALPAMLVIISTVGTMLMYTAARWTLPRVGVEMPALVPMREWRLPRVVSFLTMVAMLFLLPTLFTPGHVTVGPAGRVALNVVLVFGALYLVQGWSLSTIWLRKSMPNGLVTALQVLFLFFGFPISLYAFVFVGIWDSTLDLRSRLNPAPSAPDDPPAGPQDPPTEE